MSTTPGSTLDAMVPVSAGPDDGSVMSGAPPPDWLVVVRPTAMPSRATSVTSAATARTCRGRLRVGRWGVNQIGGPPHCPGAHCPPPSQGWGGGGAAHGPWGPGGGSPPPDPLADPPTQVPVGSTAHGAGLPEVPGDPGGLGYPGVEGGDQDRGGRYPGAPG